MTDKIQQELRNLYASAGILVPSNFKFPVCDHPIEKWCSNCDRDYVTYEKIPHFRKYKEFHTWTEKQFEKEMKNGTKTSTTKTNR